jgi:integrase
MPRRRSQPTYRLHKPSGQAIVVLSGRMIYLGPHGSKASRDLYDQKVAEWLASGRRLPSQQEPSRGGITVVEVAAAYLEFAKGYYRKDGKPTGSLLRVKAAAKYLKLYARTSAAEFGPLKLRAIQQQLISEQKSRRYTNYVVEQIKRAFKWAASMEMIPAATFHAISTVPGLRKGRCEAAEPDPIGPVDDDTVDATLPHLPPVVADMVRFQRLTGCRPGEVCIVRPCDVDTSGTVWKYKPSSHKTEHHGRERVVLIGPKAQDVLRPYLLRPADLFCFSPADSMRKLLERRHDARRTPQGAGNAPGTNRVRKPRRTAGACYTTLTYGRAITRACEVSFGMPAHLRNIPSGKESEKVELRRQAAAWRAKHCWNANQLRHSVATTVRREFGLEAAQCVLGHSRADITQVYAERDMERAAGVMGKIG